MKKRLFAALLCVLLLPLGCAGGREKIVGKAVKKADIRDFYWTYDASTYPPDFLRYRFYVEDGAYKFFWERREGDHWPLTEADRTASETIDLTEAEWDALWACLENGTVTRRTDNAESGSSGPWTFLYWEGDKGDWQVFSFASWDAQTSFEALCASLAER